MFFKLAESPGGIKSHSLSCSRLDFHTDFLDLEHQRFAVAEFSPWFATSFSRDKWPLSVNRRAAKQFATTCHDLLKLAKTRVLERS